MLAAIMPDTMMVLSAWMPLPTMSAHEPFESQAARWDAEGRPAALLAEGHELIALRCGESFRVENVAPCTHCRHTCCHRCATTGPKAANGKAGCTCGGGLVG